METCCWTRVFRKGLRRSFVGAMAGLIVFLATPAYADEESKGCVSSWKSFQDDEGTTVALHGHDAWSISPPLDYWGYAEKGVRNNTKCSQYWYQETFKTLGKRLLISGFWGALGAKQVGPLQTQLDEAQCAHSHVTYYVWGSTNLGGNYTFLGGGAKSGIWDGRMCMLTTAPNPLYPEIDLTWGTDVVDVGHSEFDSIVVAVQATSHWSGACGEFECYHPVHAVVVDEP